MAAVVTIAPGAPAIKCPSSATNITFGPGAACAIAYNSPNWRSVSQPWISTIWRCISGTTALAPPIANSDNTANCTNRAASTPGSSLIGGSRFGGQIHMGVAPPRKGDAERNQDQEDQREVEAQDSDADEAGQRHDVFRTRTPAQQRLPHLARRAHDQPRRTGGEPGEHAAQFRQRTVAAIQRAGGDHQDDGWPEQPERAGGSGRRWCAPARRFPSVWTSRPTAS